MIYETKEAKKHGMIGGYYVEIPFKATEEELEKAKDFVVEALCNQIREIAKEREDFFIIKTGERFPGLDNEKVTTVAAKFELPTVKSI